MRFRAFPEVKSQQCQTSQGDIKTKQTYSSNKLIQRKVVITHILLAALKMSYDLIAFAYAAMVALGGIIGFVKKGSIMSAAMVGSKAVWTASAPKEGAAAEARGASKGGRQGADGALG